MKNTNIYNEFIECGAIQSGHFVLSSGLHSGKYIQCARLLMQPQQTVKVVSKLVDKIKEKINDINTIISPAMGGVILGYEVARQLNTTAFFCERVNNKFEFRRSFNITPEMRILLVEDVITTAKSSLEVVDLIKKHNGSIIAEACLIDRSSGHAEKKLPFPVISLLELDIPNYNEDNLPQDLAQIPITAPGSRFINQKT